MHIMIIERFFFIRFCSVLFFLFLYWHAIAVFNGCSAVVLATGTATARSAREQNVVMSQPTMNFVLWIQSH